MLRPCLAASLLLAAAPSARAGSVHDRIYPAPTAPLSLAGLPHGAQLIRVRSSDGLDLAGIAIPGREGMPTLLVLHGNGSSAADAATWLAPLAAQGYGIVAAEYRGYSGNPGKPGEAGLLADAEAFFAFAKAQGGPVWVLGHSLGGGVAFDLALRERLDALVTVGAFTRLRAMAPGLARIFVPNDYDNLSAVGQLDEPYFLVHGSADATVSSSEGKKLHDAAGAAKRTGIAFLILGAGHKPEGAQVAAIVEAIRAWFSSGAWPLASLPPEVKLVPFGQETPLNP
jgi:fermentation-respiration switch protein FrsA (DUF1100 family)